jgi:hypothetical protein
VDIPLPTSPNVEALMMPSHNPWHSLVDLFAHRTFQQRKSSLAVVSKLAQKPGTIAVDDQLEHLPVTRRIRPLCLQRQDIHAWCLQCQSLLVSDRSRELLIMLSSLNVVSNFSKEGTE